IRRIRMVITFLLGLEVLVSCVKTGNSQETSIAIQVVDADSKQPISGARLLVQPQRGGRRAVEYTNAQGLTTYSSTAGSTAAFIQLAAPSYSLKELTVDLSEQIELKQVELKRETAPQPQPAKTITVRTAPKLSGVGASFSPFYQACSDPVPD